MRNFFSKNKLMQEVIQLTTEMETLYPELYKVLDETPLLPSTKDDNIYPMEFEQYLQTLQGQVLHHKNTHPGNNDVLPQNANGLFE